MSSELERMRAKLKEMDHNLSAMQDFREKHKEDVKRLESKCDKISKEKDEIITQVKKN